MEENKCKTCKFCEVFYHGTGANPGAFSEPRCLRAWKLCKDVKENECNYERKAG